MGNSRQLRAADGFTLGAFEAMPQGSPKGGVVVIQEIFGVNVHIREVDDAYAAAGYAAIAPQIFDRVERDVELGYEGQDMERGIGIARGQLEMDKTLMDIQAAIDEAGKHGKVGVVGYCFGGMLAWLAACSLDNVACVSAYYGGGIGGQTDKQAKCPVIMHFGELDAHIPMTEVEAIKAALPDVGVHVYDADHGFNCDHRASFNAAAAETARTRTLDFFAENLS
jgi:carboxymethylenebutenolidase